MKNWLSPRANALARDSQKWHCTELHFSMKGRCIVLHTFPQARNLNLPSLHDNSERWRKPFFCSQSRIVTWRWEAPVLIFAPSALSHCIASWEIHHTAFEGWVHFQAILCSETLHREKKSYKNFQIFWLKVSPPPRRNSCKRGKREWDKLSKKEKVLKESQTNWEKDFLLGLNI